MIKRFKDDYSWNARLNGKGRVVDDICYTGYYYILPFSEKEKKKTNWIKLSIPKRDASKFSLEQEEYEAETACMLIMNGLGYEYDRSKYLDGYLIGGQPPEYDLGMSIAAADQFISWMIADTELRNYVPNKL